MSLLELPGARGADGATPPSHEVERDFRYVGLALLWLCVVLYLFALSADVVPKKSLCRREPPSQSRGVPGQLLSVRLGGRVVPTTSKGDSAKSHAMLWRHGFTLSGFRTEVRGWKLFCLMPMM